MNSSLSVLLVTGLAMRFCRSVEVRQANTLFLTKTLTWFIFQSTQRRAFMYRETVSTFFAMPSLLAEPFVLNHPLLAVSPKRKRYRSLHSSSHATESRYRTSHNSLRRHLNKGVNGFLLQRRGLRRREYIICVVSSPS